MQLEKKKKKKKKKVMCAADKKREEKRELDWRIGLQKELTEMKRVTEKGMERVR